MKKSFLKLSRREKDIMSVLWESNKPLTASAIAESGEKFSINTVQAMLRSLLKKNYIEIAGFTYRGTVLSREYKPIITAEQYAANNLQEISKTLNFSTMNFFDYLIDDDSELLDELTRIIERKKNTEEN